MMKIFPTGHRVLVKLKKLEEKSSGGIIITREDEKAREQRAMQEAYVVRLGKNAFRDFGDGHLWCEEGQQVLIKRYSGEDREDPKTGDIYRVLNDEDIYAVVHED